MGLIFEILDEYRTGHTAVILERNKTAETGTRYAVKTKQTFRTEAEARAVYEKFLRPTPRKRSKGAKGNGKVE